MKRALACLFTLLVVPSVCFANTGWVFNLEHTWVGPWALGIFALAYAFVMLEEVLHLRKSKPVMLAAGLIWVFIAYYVQAHDLPYDVHHAIKANILEYAELFLFLLVAMTYINALEERNVFEALRLKLLSWNLSYRQLFWATGVLAFLISPVADNLTTALLMCAVVTAIAPDKPKFISLCCINIVVGANAGGAFSPFGDITTLMVWQDGVLKFYDFFAIFLPSLVNFLIPALCMHFAIENGNPAPVHHRTQIRDGGLVIIALFLATIVTAVCFHNLLNLPPAAGMMLGLGYLQIFGYFLKRRSIHAGRLSDVGDVVIFDVFQKIQRAEWDTLLFFYGIILSVGGLAAIGYLELAGNVLYGDLGATLGPMHQHTPANIVMGLVSAVIDNIPVMFAILTIHPSMSEGQWLLITLTAGVGGSLLSIGSAAGVALMGQSKGAYTFMSHLRWSWAVLLGYAASVAVHLLINQERFTASI